MGQEEPKQATRWGQIVVSHETSQRASPGSPVVWDKSVGGAFASPPLAGQMLLSSSRGRLSHQTQSPASQSTKGVDPKLQHMNRVGQFRLAHILATCDMLYDVGRFDGLPACTMSPLHASVKPPQRPLALLNTLLRKPCNPYATIVLEASRKLEAVLRANLINAIGRWADEHADAFPGVAPLPDTCVHGTRLRSPGDSVRTGENACMQFTGGQALHDHGLWQGLAQLAQASTGAGAVAAAATVPNQQ
eukprot:826140-Pelagomonas_calceolata.AAC.1